MFTIYVFMFVVTFGILVYIIERTHTTDTGDGFDLFAMLAFSVIGGLVWPLTIVLLLLLLIARPIIKLARR